MFHRSGPYICRDGLSFLIPPSCHDIVIKLLNMTINANENYPLFIYLTRISTYKNEISDFNFSLTSFFESLLSTARIKELIPVN